MSGGDPTAALIVRDVERVFGARRRLLGRNEAGVYALRGVSLTVRRGETLGIVGESGCGKSTLARLMVGLDSPTAGTMECGGVDISTASRSERQKLAGKIQYVFQDPVSAFNPRKRLGAILEAPLIHLKGMSKRVRAKRLRDLMDAVGLPVEFLERYPHELSGGQAQRIGIARALAAEPEILVLDEPVSSLDVSIQAQILNLLEELKLRLDLTYVFISHDLAVVESVSNRVAVIYFGRLAEMGPAQSVFSDPRHPYTQLLLRSAPVPGRAPYMEDEETISELPDPFNPPAGCAFAARCTRADDHCRAVQPEIGEDRPRPGHSAACYHPG